MSILSSERIQVDDLLIDVVETAIDIDITVNRPSLSTSSVSSTNDIFIQGNVNVNPVVFRNNAIGNSWNSRVSDHTLLGYKLTISCGNLICFRKQIPDYIAKGLIPNGLQEAVEQINYSQVGPCQPSEILSTFGGTPLIGYLQTKLFSLAQRHGILIPYKFMEYGEQYNGNHIQKFHATFDWLAYPLIREIDSVAVIKNLTFNDRNFISPSFKPMNFKSLVEFYYGKSTQKMLEEIWKVVAVGSEVRHTNFAFQDAEQGLEAMQRVIHDPNSITISTGTQYVTQVGNKAFQQLAFTLGPAIFKSMGFDYLYQALPSFSKRPTIRVDYPDSYTHEEHLKVLLKHLSPKRVLNLVCEYEDTPSGLSHDLSDATRMLREYDSQDKIPKGLQSQYPEGIKIDFKFKTMKEFHDKISTQYTIIKAEASKKEIVAHPLYALLDGREKDGLKLVIPRSTVPLGVWGKELNICIASYGDRAAAQSTLLLGVEKDGAIKYCIEFESLMVQFADLDMADAKPEDEVKILKLALPKMTQKHVGVMPTDVPEEEGFYFSPGMIQFRGQRNGAPDPQDRAAVETMLANWTKENLEEFRKVNALFDASNYGRQGVGGIPDPMGIGYGRLDGLMNAIRYNYVIGNVPGNIIVNGDGV